MAKIIIDDGTRKIPIENQFGKHICDIFIRPTDFSILDRYQKTMDGFKTILEPLQNLSLNNDGSAAFEKDWKTLKQVEKQIVAKFNELFDMDEAEAIFKDRSPFASVGGEFYCMKVLTAIAGVVTDALEEEAEASKARTSGYLEDLDTDEAPSEVTAEDHKNVENAMEEVAQNANTGDATDQPHS